MPEIAPLKIKTITAHEVNSYELERFIKEHYPAAKMYSFVADQEARNDSQHRFRVKKEPLDEYDQKRVADFSAGQVEAQMTSCLLSDLCNRDLIPEGTYVVSVCW